MLVHPSRSLPLVATLSGHFLLGSYAAHARATAASASLAWTSTSAIWEPGSGALRMVAGPLTTTLQPSGAMNVFPATVVFGVSAVIRSGTASLGCAAAGADAAGVGVDAAGAESAGGGALTVGAVDEQATVVTRRAPRNARMGRTIHG